jgi:hypothetical protein
MSADYLFGKSRSMEAALSDLIEAAEQPIRSGDRDRLELMIQYLKDEIDIRSQRRNGEVAPNREPRSAGLGGTD